MNIDHLNIDEALRYEVPIDAKNHGRLLEQFESNYQSALVTETEDLSQKVEDLEESNFVLQLAVDDLCDILSHFKDQLTTSHIETLRNRNLQSQLGIE